MALQCAILLSQTATNAGQTPPVPFSIVVYNPNASPVTVTGVRVFAQLLGQPGFSAPMANEPLVPIGPGQTTTVPPLGTITIGPMSGVLPSVGSSANAFQGVPMPGTQWTNTNPAEPPQVTAQISAYVYASDGSVNVAVPMGLTASGYLNPPQGYQGGYLNFAAPNNFGGGILLGVL